MKIENIDQRQAAWDIRWRAKELLEAIQALPGQDYFNATEVENTIKKVDTDTNEYYERKRKELDSMFKVGEIYMTSESDGVSGVEYVYLELTGFNKEMEEVVCNLLTRRVGEFDNCLEYKEKESFSLDYVKGDFGKNAKTGPEVRAEFLRYQNILKNA